MTKHRTYCMLIWNINSKCVYICIVFTCIIFVALWICQFNHLLYMICFSTIRQQKICIITLGANLIGRDRLLTSYGSAVLTKLPLKSFIGGEGTCNLYIFWRLLYEMQELVFELWLLIFSILWCLIHIMMCKVRIIFKYTRYQV